MRLGRRRSLGMRLVGGEPGNETREEEEPGNETSGREPGNESSGRRSLGMSQEWGGWQH